MSQRFTLLVLLLLVIALAGSLSSAPHPTKRARLDAGDVLAFGARGDGEADDTGAIQKAVESGAGSIRFPPGVYRVTRPIVIDLDKRGFTSLAADGTARVVVAGPGPAFRFIGTHEGTADPASVKENVWRNERGPMVDGLEIVGEHEQACGIEAKGTVQLTLSRLIIRRCLHGIHLIERNRNVILSDSHFYENRGIGLYLDDVDLHQINVTGCHISYNQRGGIVSRMGNVRNLQINGCDIEDNMEANGPPTANVLIDCTGSVYGTGEVAITGSTIQHGHDAVESANIRIIGRSSPTAELPLVREGHVTITGNVFSDVQVNLHLKECRGVVVTGNTFWMGFAHNLLIEDCSNIVLGPNNFDRNPRYDYGDSREASNSLVLRKTEDSTLTGLHLNSVGRSQAALLVEDCRRLNISNCTVLDCDGVGLLLKNTSECRISDCLVRDDRPHRGPVPSLVITGGKGNLVVDNLLGNGYEAAEGSAHFDANADGP